MTSFNGEACTYDALGNPTTYRGKTLEWTKIRRLAKFGDVEFTYNANGLRNSKTANGVTHSYILEGDKILRENIGTSSLTYYYGNNGIIGFNYNGVDYFYHKNIQGDVIAIYTSSGAKVASYVYDAWGNHKIFDVNGNEVTTTTHIGYINPVRYRGYYYDVETGLYYVSSRYYDPEIGRWINADNQIAGVGGEVLGYNVFAYYINNPVNLSDPTGNWPKWKDVVNFGKKAVDYLVQGLINSLNSIATTLIKTVHYNRNKLNKTDYTPEELGDPLPDDKSKFHQNNKKDNKSNKKYVIGEWFSSEVVYYSDGTINNTPEDEGTFNVYSGDNMILNFAVHGTFDVIPYMIWGNRPNDSTTIIDRFIMIFQ